MGACIYIYLYSTFAIRYLYEVLFLIIKIIHTIKVKIKLIDMHNQTKTKNCQAENFFFTYNLIN